MALRTTCLYQGKIIGIESIFTVRDGKQINIPDKVEAMRAKSRRGELFCACGCGANVVLVAGDRNLREQHFRLKDAEREENCQYVSEGPDSINSKIVLKCWLDEKLEGAEVETRVPICDISDSERRYELSFLAKSKGIAVSYCHNRANLSDEKIEILEQNTQGIRVHYIEHITNAGQYEQYPEMMMKVFKRQDYCLLLKCPAGEGQRIHYEDAILRACYYYQNEDGLWHEVEIVTDLLQRFSFAPSGELLYRGTPMETLRAQRQQAWETELEQRRLAWKRLQAERRAEADRMRLQREQQEEERKTASIREQEEFELQQKERRELLLQKRAEQEREKAEEIEKTREQVDAVIDNIRDEPFRDSKGNRWVRCIYCGKVDFDQVFTSYGGPDGPNRGMCRDCCRKDNIEILPRYRRASEPVCVQAERMEPKDEELNCPICHKTLVKRIGRYGSFWGCTGYPHCRYTRDI